MDAPCHETILWAYKSSLTERGGGASLYKVEKMDADQKYTGQVGMEIVHLHKSTSSPCGAPDCRLLGTTCKSWYIGPFGLGKVDSPSEGVAGVSDKVAYPGINCTVDNFTINPFIEPDKTARELSSTAPRSQREGMEMG